MTDVKPRKSSAGGAKKRKLHTLPGQRGGQVAGTTQPPRRKELEERAALALFDQAQRLDGDRSRVGQRWAAHTGQGKAAIDA